MIERKHPLTWFRIRQTSHLDSMSASFLINENMINDRTSSAKHTFQVGTLK